MLQPLCNWWSRETWITLPPVTPPNDRIVPFDAQDDVGVSKMRCQLVPGERLGRMEMHGMIGREHGAYFRRGADISSDCLRERHAVLPRRQVARYAAGENDRMPGRLEPLSRLLDVVRWRGADDRRHIAPGLDRRQRPVPRSI